MSILARTMFASLEPLHGIKQEHILAGIFGRFSRERLAMARLPASASLRK